MMNYLAKAMHSCDLISKPIIAGLSIMAISSTVLTGCTTSPYENNPNIYMVKSGDTLGGIATRYKVNYKVLARLNNLDANYTILAGQPLRLNTNAPETPQSKAPQKVAVYGTPKPIVRPITTITPANPVNQTTTPYSSVSTTAPVAVNTPSTTNTPSVNNVANTWLWPVQGTVLQKMDLNTNIKGIYIGGKTGDIIRASNEGEVAYADNKLKGYGNLILIRHTGGYITAYANLGQMLVSNGNRVQAGQAIGIMGMGKLNQPMMEFQIRLNGNPQDPLGLLAPVN